MAPNTAPNFDAVLGHSRFLASEGRLKTGGTSVYHVYDYYLHRTFYLRYPGCDNIRPGKAQDDLKELIESVGDCDVITVELDGTTTLSNAESPPTDWQLMPSRVTFDRLDQFDNVQSTVLRSNIKVSGAIKPSVYVIGTWEAIYKRIIFIFNAMRINNEIKARAAVGDHPYVLPIKDVVIFPETDKSNGTIWRVGGITLPFVPGGDFDNRMEFKLKWFAQLMQTVDEFRNKYHIAHSDIAPRNILVDPHDDNIRIIDFELCEPIPPKELDIDPPSTAMEPISRVPDLGDLIEEPTEVDVDGPSTVIAVYETVTKRDPGMDGEKDWCQTPERIRARLQFVKMATWELGSGVETDVDVDSLKELVETWVEEREEVGYTWESFVQRTPLFRIFGLESTLLSTRSIS